MLPVRYSRTRLWIFTTHWVQPSYRSSIFNGFCLTHTAYYEYAISSLNVEQHYYLVLMVFGIIAEHKKTLLCRMAPSSSQAAGRLSGGGMAAAAVLLISQRVVWLFAVSFPSFGGVCLRLAPTCCMLFHSCLFGAFS